MSKETDGRACEKNSILDSWWDANEVYIESELLDLGVFLISSIRKTATNRVARARGCPAAHQIAPKPATKFTMSRPSKLRRLSSILGGFQFEKCLIDFLWL